MLGIEPWAYLRDLLCLLPDWPKHRVLELAPAYWTSTVTREDVRAKLEANPYRAATLARDCSPRLAGPSRIVTDAIRRADQER